MAPRHLTKQETVYPVYSREQPTVYTRVRQKPGLDIFLFALFALYGPSIQVFGQLRYVEIVVLAVLGLGFVSALKRVGKWEKIFAGLFLLTAFMQVISDLVNHANLDGTLKRSFTYIILPLLIVSIKSISGGSLRRLKWIVGGYCFSFLTVLIIGQSASRFYGEMPWRLGLGTAATVAVCLIPLWYPRAYRFVGPALLAMSVVHLLMSGRAMAFITAVAGIITLWGFVRGRPAPSKIRAGSIILVAALGLMGSWLALEGLAMATRAQLFPPEMQFKMEAQMSNPYGLLAAGRPDTAAAIFGISKRPILGFGSTNADPDVMAFYHRLNALSYSDQVSFSDRLWREMSKEWELGNPSHSHLFGAWVDAGVLAAISWIVVFGVAFYIAVRSMKWRDPRAPLAILISLFVMWDTIFSPGPIRMDVAIRLAILIYVLNVFKDFDAHWKKVKAMKKLQFSGDPLPSNRDSFK